MSRGVKLIPVAALLAGCGLSARDALLAADARWRAATGVLEPWPSGIEMRYGTFDCGPVSPAVGCYNSTTDSVTIDLSNTDAEIQQIAVHEWGHKLGAGHAKPGQGVLAPRLSEARACITAADLELVCALRTCAWERPECL